jgi:hypothetical protein
MAGSAHRPARLDGLARAVHDDHELPHVPGQSDAARRGLVVVAWSRALKDDPAEDQSACPRDVFVEGPAASIA